MGDTNNINTIFQSIDSDGSGYLDKEKLHRICPNLSETEIESIFNDLDTDHDNRISLKEFIDGFKELIQSNASCSTLLKKTFADNKHISNQNHDSIKTQIQEVFSNLQCQEQIYDFYETLRNGSNESAEQFRSILESFVHDIIEYQKEIKRLDDSYRREKEMNENYLRRIEEEQERDMRQLEEKIRKEERQKFDLERELIEQRASKTLSDLQANVQRLQTIEKHYRDKQLNEDSMITLLREEVSKLTQENQMINLSLNESLTSNTILKSDIQALKAQLNERQTMLLRETQASSNIYHEKESLESNIRQLVEVNKKLRDENDTLHATIESRKLFTTSNSDIPLVSKRSMSRTGSILENYWNNNNNGIRKQGKSSEFIPIDQHYVHSQRMNSFDIESTDEIADRSSHNDIRRSSILSRVRSTIDRNNLAHDSGLSLTTVRDTNEFESDRDSSLNLINTKQNSSVSMKRNNKDSDSDDVFDENSIDRNGLKRISQHRSPKRSSSNGNLTLRNSTNQSLSANIFSTKKQIRPSENDAQYEQLTCNLPFDRMYKVVFCGDAAVGKSTLIMRLCKGKFVSNLNSTLGVDFQNKQLEIDSKRIAIQLWDTAGQERFRSIAKSYFRRCDGVILVYDSTYERSFLNVREWIDTIVEATPKKVSIMIVGNKIDLRDQIRNDGKRVVEHSDGFKLSKEYNTLFIETSAKDGTNSDEILIELARDMQCNEDLERYRTAGIDLDKKPKKATCCSNRS